MEDEEEENREGSQKEEGEDIRKVHKTIEEGEGKWKIRKEERK